MMIFSILEMDSKSSSEESSLLFLVSFLYFSLSLSFLSLAVSLTLFSFFSFSFSWFWYFLSNAFLRSRTLTFFFGEALTFGEGDLLRFLSMLSSVLLRETDLLRCLPGLLSRP